MSKHEFLDLGRQPIANRFLNQDEFEDEFFYDLKVGFDTETCLVTHMNYVDAPMMFNDEYSYRGSMSATMRNHFSSFSKSIKTSLPIIPKVLEIQGYGSMMMLSLVIGLGLILGAYEEKWK